MKSTSFGGQSKLFMTFREPIKMQSALAVPSQWKPCKQCIPNSNPAPKEYVVTLKQR